MRIGFFLDKVPTKRYVHKQHEARSFSVALEIRELTGLSLNFMEIVI